MSMSMSPDDIKRQVLDHEAFDMSSHHLELTDMLVGNQDSANPPTHNQAVLGLMTLCHATARWILASFEDEEERQKFLAEAQKQIAHTLGATDETSTKH